jgi:hypothetical protein
MLRQEYSCIYKIHMDPTYTIRVYKFRCELELLICGVPYAEEEFS